VGFPDLHSYAVEYLQHTGRWCHDIIELFESEKDFQKALTKADRNEEIRARRAAGEKQLSIADDVGLHQSTVSRICEKPDRSPKTHNTPRKSRYELQPGTKPETAAKKISEKFGEKYALNLASALTLKLMS
jgi:hypothetical protein